MGRFRVLEVFVAYLSKQAIHSIMIYYPCPPPKKITFLAPIFGAYVIVFSRITTRPIRMMKGSIRFYHNKSLWHTRKTLFWCLRPLYLLFLSYVFSGIPTKPIEMIQAPWFGDSIITSCYGMPPKPYLLKAPIIGASVIIDHLFWIPTKPIERIRHRMVELQQFVINPTPGSWARVLVECVIFTTGSEYLV